MQLAPQPADNRHTARWRYIPHYGINIHNVVACPYHNIISHIDSKFQQAMLPLPDVTSNPDEQLKRFVFEPLASDPLQVTQELGLEKVAIASKLPNIVTRHVAEAFKALVHPSSDAARNPTGDINFLNGHQNHANLLRCSRLSTGLAGKSSMLPLLDEPVPYPRRSQTLRCIEEYESKAYLMRASAMPPHSAGNLPGCIAVRILHDRLLDKATSCQSKTSCFDSLSSHNGSWSDHDGSRSGHEGSLGPSHDNSLGLSSHPPGQPPDVKAVAAHGRPGEVHLTEHMQADSVHVPPAATVLLPVSLPSHTIQEAHKLQEPHKLQKQHKLQEPHKLQELHKLKKTQGAPETLQEVYVLPDQTAHLYKIGTAALSDIADNVKATALGPVATHIPNCLQQFLLEFLAISESSIADLNAANMLDSNRSGTGTDCHYVLTQLHIASTGHIIKLLSESTTRCCASTRFIARRTTARSATAISATALQPIVFHNWQRRRGMLKREGLSAASKLRLQSWNTTPLCEKSLAHSATKSYQLEYPILQFTDSSTKGLMNGIIHYAHNLLSPCMHGQEINGRDSHGRESHGQLGSHGRESHGQLGHHGHGTHAKWDQSWYDPWKTSTGSIGTFHTIDHFGLNDMILDGGCVERLPEVFLEDEPDAESMVNMCKELVTQCGHLPLSLTYLELYLEWFTPWHAPVGVKPGISMSAVTQHSVLSRLIPPAVMKCSGEGMTQRNFPKGKRAYGDECWVMELNQQGVIDPSKMGGIDPSKQGGVDPSKQEAFDPNKARDGTEQLNGSGGCCKVRTNSEERGDETRYNMVQCTSMREEEAIPCWPSVYEGWVGSTLCARLKNGAGSQFVVRKPKLDAAVPELVLRCMKCLTLQAEQDHDAGAGGAPKQSNPAVCGSSLAGQTGQLKDPGQVEDPAQVKGPVEPMQRGPFTKAGQPKDPSQPIQPGSAKQVDQPCPSRDQGTTTAPPPQGTAPVPPGETTLALGVNKNLFELMAKIKGLETRSQTQTPLQNAQVQVSNTVDSTASEGWRREQHPAGATPSTDNLLHPGLALKADKAVVCESNTAAEGRSGMAEGRQTLISSCPGRLLSLRPQLYEALVVQLENKGIDIIERRMPYVDMAFAPSTGVSVFVVDQTMQEQDVLEQLTFHVARVRLAFRHITIIIEGPHTTVAQLHRQAHATVMVAAVHAKAALQLFKSDGPSATQGLIMQLCQQLCSPPAAQSVPPLLCLDDKASRLEAALARNPCISPFLACSLARGRTWLAVVEGLASGKLKDTVLAWMPKVSFPILQHMLTHPYASHRNFPQTWLAKHHAPNQEVLAMLSRRAGATTHTTQPEQELLGMLSQCTGATTHSTQPKQELLGLLSQRTGATTHNVPIHHGRCTAGGTVPKWEDLDTEFPAQSILDVAAHSYRASNQKGHIKQHQNSSNNRPLQQHQDELYDRTVQQLCNNAAFSMRADIKRCASFTKHSSKHSNQLGGFDQHAGFHHNDSYYDNHNDNNVDQHGGGNQDMEFNRDAMFHHHGTNASQLTRQKRPADSSRQPHADIWRLGEDDSSIGPDGPVLGPITQSLPGREGSAPSRKKLKLTARGRGGSSPSRMQKVIATHGRKGSPPCKKMQLTAVIGKGGTTDILDLSQLPAGQQERHAHQRVLLDNVIRLRACEQLFTPPKPGFSHPPKQDYSGHRNAPLSAAKAKHYSQVLRSQGPCRVTGALHSQGLCRVRQPGAISCQPGAGARLQYGGNTHVGGRGLDFLDSSLFDCPASFDSHLSMDDLSDSGPGSQDKCLLNRKTHAVHATVCTAQHAHDSKAHAGASHMTQNGSMHSVTAQGMAQHVHHTVQGTRRGHVAKITCGSPLNLMSQAGQDPDPGLPPAEADEFGISMSTFTMTDMDNADDSDENIACCTLPSAKKAAAINYQIPLPDITALDTLDLGPRENLHLPQHTAPGLQHSMPEPKHGKQLASKPCDDCGVQGQAEGQHDKQQVSKCHGGSGLLGRPEHQDIKQQVGKHFGGSGLRGGPARQAPVGGIHGMAGTAGNKEKAQAMLQRMERTGGRSKACHPKLRESKCKQRKRPASKLTPNQSRNIFLQQLNSPTQVSTRRAKP